MGITDKQPKELVELTSGQYVSMFGNVRTAPTVHFVATGMRIVTCADEICYHMIESAHAALKLQNGMTSTTAVSPKKQMPMAANADAPRAPPQEIVVTTPNKTAALEGPALRNFILA